MTTETMTASLEDIKVKEEKPVGQWTLVWRRLRRHKLAMTGMAIMIFILLISFAAPLIAPYPYTKQNLKQQYTTWMTPGKPGEAMHYMGTDGLGRDTFTRILYAGRISLSVALVVTVLNVLIGTLIGATAGALGGTTDSVLMRFTDIMLTLPNLPILLILSSSLRQFAALQKTLGSSLSLIVIILVLSVFGWMGNARLVRGSVLSLRNMDYIEAARALGASKAQIIFRHLVPNSLAPIIVAATLGFGAVIIAESALSFLGFGIMPPVPTWGNMLNEARMAPQTGFTLFTQTLAPGLCVFLTVLSINFLGDGLRDALDPRLKM